MSLVVAVYVPSGIVMAGDSRMTFTRQEKKEAEGQQVTVREPIVLSDNAYKVMKLNVVPVGVAAFDTGVIHNQPVDAHVRRFDEEAITEEDTVTTVPEKLVQYFQRGFPKVPVGFFLAGYTTENRVSVPHVFACHTVKEPHVQRINVDKQGTVDYGVLRAGDTAVVNRLVAKDALPLFAAMPLQDAVDYSIYLIRTTIETLRFEPRYPSVGGFIDVLVVTPDEMRFVQRKELRGETV
jgi:hypothetical protein